MKTRLVLLCVALLVPTLACWADTSSDQILQAGTPAPDWTLKDPQGKTHRLSDYRGKVVVMDFWATWCGPCRMEMPEIQKVSQEFASQGVSVMGMNVWENGDAAEFMKNNGYTYSLLLNADDAATQYDVQAIPALFVVDGKGVIYYSQLGYSGDSSLTDAVKRCLSVHR